jgi:hypothetical protein
MNAMMPIVYCLMIVVAIYLIYRLATKAIREEKASIVRVLSGDGFPVVLYYEETPAYERGDVPSRFSSGLMEMSEEMQMSQHVFFPINNEANFEMAHVIGLAKNPALVMKRVNSIQEILSPTVPPTPQRRVA